MYNLKKVYETILQNEENVKAQRKRETEEKVKAAEEEIMGYYNTNKKEILSNICTRVATYLQELAKKYNKDLGIYEIGTPSNIRIDVGFIPNESINMTHKFDAKGDEACYRLDITVKCGYNLELYLIDVAHRLAEELSKEFEGSTAEKSVVTIPFRED